MDDDVHRRVVRFHVLLIPGENHAAGQRSREFLERFEKHLNGNKVEKEFWRSLPESVPTRIEHPHPEALTLPEELTKDQRKELAKKVREERKELDKFDEDDLP